MNVADAGRVLSNPCLVSLDHEVPLTVAVQRGAARDVCDEPDLDGHDLAVGLLADRIARRHGYELEQIHAVEDAEDEIHVQTTATGHEPRRSDRRE